MERTLEVWFAIKSDSEIDELLRHYEFVDVHADELFELLKPLKEARYLVHELHKGFPPEEWMKIPVEPERRREIRRAMIIADRDFETQRRRLFQNFRQTVTAKSLRTMKKDIQEMANSPSLNKLLSLYDSIERRLTQVEAYVSSAERDADFMADVARGK